MKHILYIIGITSLLCGFTACSTRELQTDEIKESFTAAFSNERADSLQIDITLEWPIKGLTSSALQNIQQELGTAILGKATTESNIRTLINEFLSGQKKEYRQSIHEELSFCALENCDYGIYSWYKMLEGNFLEPYENMQSYLLVTYEYTGGAHGIDSETGFTFDLTSGNRISEEDLFINGYKPILSELLTQKLPQTVEQDIYEILFITTIEPNENFYVTPEGITYVYERYEIAPYVCGIIEVTIPWNELNYILK